MTMFALAFSSDFCVVAVDRAVGALDERGLTPGLDKTTKLKYFNNREMPIVATAAGLSGAVEFVPRFIAQNTVNRPEHIKDLACYLAKSMKQELSEDFWSQTHTTSCFLALDPNGMFFVHALYHNEETVLFSGFEPTLSVIPAGFGGFKFKERKKQWEQAITKAIQPESVSDTPCARLNRVLATLTEAFRDCSTIDDFVSEEFDYCVISKSERKIYFNEAKLG